MDLVSLRQTLCLIDVGRFSQFCWLKINLCSNKFTCNRLSEYFSSV